MRANTSLACLPDSVPLSISATSSASAAGGTGRSAAASWRASATRRQHLVDHPVGDLLGQAAAPAPPRGVEVVGDLLLRHQHARVLRRQPQPVGVAGEAILGQLGQRPARLGQRRLVHHHRRQIGLGEVAVVVRLLLGAHRRRQPAGGVPQPRLLHDALAPFEQRRPAGLISCSMASFTFLNELMFFSSALVPSLLLAAQAHRHVGVAAERALFHVAVADAQVAHQRAHRPQVLRRLLGRADVGLADHLAQRHAGAVVVDQLDARRRRGCSCPRPPPGGCGSGAPGAARRAGGR